MNINTRQTLIERIQLEKTDESWEEFYEIYSRYLYVVIRNMNVNASDAEDILQEALLKAWKGLPKFTYEPGKHRFRSWLLTVVRNTLRTFVSRKARKTSHLLETDSAETQAYLESIAISEDDDQAELEWRKYVIDLAMENIRGSVKPHVFEIFQDYLNGLKTEDIAQKHGLPENTVRVYKKRVKTKLQYEVSRLEADLG